jgi:1,2-dihydroxy-3-keto-5-methylthiopentene dioxygenase
MAILLQNDGTTESDLSVIVDELKPMGINLRHYDPGTLLLFPELIEQETITDAEKRHIVGLHNSVFEFLQQENGYLWSDLLNIHPGSPNLETWTATYGRYHTHHAAEAIYLLAGEIIYGFMKPDGGHLQLLMTSQDYLHIPAGVEHWCSPAASLHFKVIRYFTTVAGWMPIYTGTHQKFKI